LEQDDTSFAYPRTRLRARAVLLPDWPRLMPIELAAAYLSRSVSTLRERGPTPKRDGRSVLYDRADLDRWADCLGGQPLSPTQREEEAKDVERRFLERRRGRR
jgi:hypothetical protein